MESIKKFFNELTPKRKKLLVIGLITLLGGGLLFMGYKFRDGGIPVKTGVERKKKISLDPELLERAYSDNIKQEFEKKDAELNAVRFLTRANAFSRLQLNSTRPARRWKRLKRRSMRTSGRYTSNGRSTHPYRTILKRQSVTNLPSHPGPGNGPRDSGIQRHSLQGNSFPADSRPGFHPFHRLRLRGHGHGPRLAMRSLSRSEG
ncbi:MAG: hypothetical protein HY954_07150 [Deltaproteobacteria bacterium]|nr:hypothetical protein [Deltaproteobacteria bacterium]